MKHNSKIELRGWKVWWGRWRGNEKGKKDRIWPIWDEQMKMSMIIEKGGMQLTLNFTASYFQDELINCLDKKMSKKRSL